MAAGNDVIFELELRTGQVTFHQTGSWADLLQKNVGIPYDYQALADQFVDHFVDRDHKEEALQAINLSSLREAYVQQLPIRVLELLVLNVETGKYEWHHVNIVVSTGGKCFGTIQNMQVEKERELILQHNASHDGLTDLYNRSTFNDFVMTLFAEDEILGAFFIVDIDNFKEINDTLGHQRGDEVIVGLAQQLRKLLPHDAVLGRFGGDEFTCFIPGDGNPESYLGLAEVLCATIEKDWKAEGITVSIGMALYPSQATTVGELLSLADRALYFVKNNGKNSHAIFDETMPDLNMPSRIAAMAAQKAHKIVLHTLNWRNIGAIVMGFMAVMGLLVFLVGAYSGSLQTMVQEESAEYLMEISQQIGGSITDKLDMTLSHLEVMGEMLSQGHIETMDNLAEIFDSQCEQMDFDRLIAIDDQGIGYHDGQTIYYAPLQEHIAKVVLDREAFMTDAINIDGADYVLFFVPVSNIEIDSIQIAAIAAFVDMENMNQKLSLTAFDNAGFAEIVNMNGAVVIRSGHKDSELDGYNLFTCFANQVFTNGYSLEQIRNDFNKGAHGVTRYMRHGEQYVSYYSKMAGHDWMLFCTTPASVLEAKSSDYIRITAMACAIVALLIMGLMSCILVQQVRSKRKLTIVAYTDPVTEGANREKFIQDVKEILARSSGEFIMLYGNIEHFKRINDQFGSDEADGLLKYIFQVFEADLDNHEMVARLSGDHYAIWCNDMPDHLLEERLHLWNRKITQYPTTASAGFTLSMTYGLYRIEKDVTSVDVMIDRANMARKAGTSHINGSNIFFYDNALREAMQWEQTLENDMASALAKGEFQMYLQPKCSAGENRVVGFEALVRWLRLDGTLLPPSRFIALFEKNGFIIKLDHYIFEQACQALAEQIAQGNTPASIAVNVSRAHLLTDNLLAPYIEIWKKYAIPAELLELEFTESTIYDNIARLQKVVEHIHQVGFTCSIDDFGSGYSSLNMLNLVNVDIVKMDRSFLGSGAVISKRSSDIIQSVIDLSHKIGMTVVAEGVESLEQAEFLKASGCDYFQGYYFGKPQPAREALQLSGQILPKG